VGIPGSDTEMKPSRILDRMSENAIKRASNSQAIKPRGALDDLVPPVCRREISHRAGGAAFARAGAAVSQQLSRLRLEGWDPAPRCKTMIYRLAWMPPQKIIGIRSTRCFLQARRSGLTRAATAPDRPNSRSDAKRARLCATSHAARLRPQILITGRMNYSCCVATVGVLLSCAAAVRQFLDRRVPLFCGFKGVATVACPSAKVLGGKIRSRRFGDMEFKSRRVELLNRCLRVRPCSAAAPGRSPDFLERLCKRPVIIWSRHLLCPLLRCTADGSIFRRA